MFSYCFKTKFNSFEKIIHEIAGDCWKIPLLKLKYPSMQFWATIVRKTPIWHQEVEDPVWLNYSNANDSQHLVVFCFRSSNWFSWTWGETTIPSIFLTPTKMGRITAFSSQWCGHAKTFGLLNCVLLRLLICWQQIILFCHPTSELHRAAPTPSWR